MITKVAMPQDDNLAQFQLVPPVTALATTVNASISSQVEITLNTKTSFVEVNTLSQGLYLKWKTVAGGSAVSSSNFDEFVLANSVRHYAVPVSQKVVAVIEQTASSTIIMIEK